MCNQNDIELKQRLNVFLFVFRLKLLAFMYTKLSLFELLARVLEGIMSTERIDLR